MVLGKEFFMSFKESTGLNYQRGDMSYITIKSRGQENGFNNVEINDPEKIKEIISYINSLELVEVKKTNITCLFPRKRPKVLALSGQVFLQYSVVYSRIIRPLNIASSGQRPQAS